MIIKVAFMYWYRTIALILLIAEFSDLNQNQYDNRAYVVDFVNISACSHECGSNASATSGSSDM